MPDIPLYSSEHGIDPGPDLDDMGEIQGWVDHVVRSRWWRSRSALRKVRVQIQTKREIGARKRSWAKGEIVTYRPISRQILLHELAHLIIWKNVGKTGRSDHRSEFIATYVEMVEQFMGRRHAKRLARRLLDDKIHGAKVALDACYNSG